MVRIRKKPKPQGLCSSWSLWLVGAISASVVFYMVSDYRMTVEVTVNMDSLPNMDSILDLKPTPKATIVYAISLIKCGDFQSSTEGLSDAAIVLRHSIHRNSIRDPTSGSRYDYKMFAIVHEQAAQCASQLRQAGFDIMVRPPPIKKDEIRGDFLRKNIHREWCCGHDEFIKLYAYQIEAPLVVHMDIDFTLHRPLDHLFDVMLESDSDEARAKVEREFPNQPWPAQRVDAMMTRDWPQVIPGRKAAYQAGFIINRPDKQVFDEIVEVIREGNYTEGFGRDNGWGGMGYGGFVGAMAMQGLLAFYYDQFRPNSWLELDECRHNHMGMQVVTGRGRCRNNQKQCEDCRKTDTSLIYSIHYTQCRKPWQCIGNIPDPNDKFAKRNNKVIPTHWVDYDHCMDLVKIWHDHRTNLEDQLYALTGDKTILDGRTGPYKKDIFQGHCNDNGNSAYIGIKGTPESLQRIPELYSR